eukprot:1148445-Pelagomonas_calceolata.AAC.4
MKTLKVSQTKMTANLISKYGMDNAKTKTTPLSPDTKLTKQGEPMETSTYSYMGALAKYMFKPTTDQWNTREVLKCQAGSVDHRITYGPSKSELQGYSDGITLET